MPESFGQLARDLLKAQETLRDAYETAVSGKHLDGRSYSMPFEDWGDLFWRLADDEQAIVFSENAEAVGSGDNTHDDVLVEATSHVWRPSGADVVFAVVGNFEQVVVLDLARERPCPPND